MPETSIEVQINARVDKLDAGLRVAEQKIGASVDKINKIAEVNLKVNRTEFDKGMQDILNGISAQDMDSPIGKMRESLAADMDAAVDALESVRDPIAAAAKDVMIGYEDAVVVGASKATKIASAAVTKSTSDISAEIGSQMQTVMMRAIGAGAIIGVLDDALDKVATGIAAGDSAAKIGVAAAEGILENFKSVPIIGSIAAITEAALYGAEKLVEARRKQYEQEIERTYAKSQSLLAELGTAEKQASENIQDARAGEGSRADIENKRMREVEAAENTAKARRDAANNIFEESAKLSGDTERLREGHGKTMARIAQVRENELFAIAIKAQKQHDALTVSAREVQEKWDEATYQHDVALAEKQLKAESDVAAVALIAMEKAAKAQEKIDKNARVSAEQALRDERAALQAPTMRDKQQDEMNRAQSAAQNMIQSGSTALGQFNFAQDGAANMALAVAKEQSKKLDKLENIDNRLAALNAGVLR